MSPADKKRLKELETKRNLVHKGTGKTFEVETGPGGVETWVDDDQYEWTGTVNEEREYNALCMKQANELFTESLNDLRKMLVTDLYGGKQLNM